ncbi:hypothetical protein V1460_04050 [Streptomyces sp. SCSIO 30461]|uniref:hypothetical protein n=1 Tax=Streptomyces sp. SCSIO 30461 TaxID=3118085 RepID=UPI0030D4E60A
MTSVALIVEPGHARHSLDGAALPSGASTVTGSPSRQGVTANPGTDVGTVPVAVWGLSVASAKDG